MQSSEAGSGSKCTVPLTMLVLLSLTVQASGEELCNKHMLLSHDLQFGLQLMVLLQDLQQGTASKVRCTSVRCTLSCFLTQGARCVGTGTLNPINDPGHRISLSLCIKPWLVQKLWCSLLLSIESA